MGWDKFSSLMMTQQIPALVDGGSAIAVLFGGKKHQVMHGIGLL